jgi:coenzyme F420 hydrogenase subunit beta
VEFSLNLKKGPEALEAEVLRADLCCVCGACMGLCPYFKAMHERVVLIEPCGLTEGRCYDICPRTKVDMEALNQEVFGKPRDDFVLGTHNDIYMAQAKDAKVKRSGQYGGMVSALLIYALKKKLIDGAILAGNSPRYPLLPEPVLARSPQDVLACAGSKYTACPSLAILDKSLRECENLAFVGRPCQVTALRKRISIEPAVGQKIALIIGLFCMWSLSYRDLVQHLKAQLDLSRARRFDIPYNRFIVYIGREKKEVDFEPIKDMRRHTCDICYDFTGELADISLGSTEWKDTWNTLITRTDRGEKMVTQAKRAGVITVKPFPPNRVELLRTASLNKKKRVVKALFEEGEKEPYLKVSEAEKDWIRNK